MRRITGLLILGLFCLGMILMPAASGEKEKQDAGKTPAASGDKDKEIAKEKEKMDITAQMREMNSDQFQSPPTEFRAGHVTVRKLDPKMITKAAGGFSIKLPSGAPIPTPTVYKGKIYVSGGFHSKEYYCFDAITGALIWGVNLDDDGPTSAVVEDDICIFNTESCTIFALEAQTGKHLWSYFLGDPLTSTPTIAGGKVFTSYPAAGRGGFPGKGKSVKAAGKEDDKKPAVGKRPNASHVLACFELKTGKILWQRWIDSDVMSAPVAVDNDIYATSFGGTVYKFKQNDGDILSAVNSRATSAPCVVGKEIYLTQRAEGKDAKVAGERITGGTVTAAGTVAQKFESDAKEAKYLDKTVQDKSTLKKQSMDLDAGNGFSAGAPAVANPKAAYDNIGVGNVSSMQGWQGSRVLNYRDNNFNCMGNEVVCTDPSNGKMLWSVKLKGDLEKVGGFLASPPAAAGGKIFLSTLQGEVLQLDPADGKLVETYKIGSPVRFQPAIEGGRIYVGTQDGKVVCVDTGNEQFTGWTTWGANSAHTNVVEKAK